MREKVLITVKTYPTLSGKYQELVCTAGVNAQGEWRRIYPVQFRQLQSEQRYRKYQWIGVELQHSTTDSRPETFKIVDSDSLEILGEPLSTRNEWEARRKAFVNRVEVHGNLQAIIDSAHNNELSLALFRPTRWIRFHCEPCERDWDPNKIAALEAERKQHNLFKSDAELQASLKVVEKLPYKFSYEFEDARGKRSKLMIEDWEIGALYRNCLRDTEGDEGMALAKVREKYWDEFILKESMDTHLILGTTLEHHNKKAPNPFVIIGVVPLPQETQPKLVL